MADAPTETLLEHGEHCTLRVWREEEPNADKPAETCEYETLGYVVKGVVELTLDGHTRWLRAGDTYIVPKHALHRYVVRERLTAIEALAPKLAT